MIITKSIHLDLAQRNPPDRITVKEGDANSRCVEITLLSNSVSWPVPEGTTAAVRYRKADGKAGLYDTLPDGTTPAVTYDGNVLTVNLAPQMLAIGLGRGSSAEVYADVLLINGDSLLATFDFILEVWRNPVSGSTLESQDYYKVVSLEQINAALAKLGEEIESLNTGMQDAAATAAVTAQTADAATKLAGENAAGIAALKFQVSQTASGIVETAEGKIITLTDSSDKPLQGLIIYGRTTQDGTPTPDNPVELVSAGDGGSVGTTILSAQLFDVGAKASTTRNGITFTVDKDNGTISAKGTNTYSGNTYFSYVESNLHLRNGRMTFAGCPPENPNVWVQIFNADGVSGAVRDTGQGVTYDFVNEGGIYGEYNISFGVAPGATVDAVFKPMLNYGDEKKPWEPYNDQTLTLSTPNGLPGIPVTSGGNYTDAHGQRWIANYRDYARGVDVQCVDCIASYAGEVITTQYISTTGQLSAGATVLYMLDTPIETPIPADELAAYKALHANCPNTTIYNDAGAHMEVQYVADTKLYIDKQINALAQAIVNNIGG